LSFNFQKSFHLEFFKIFTRRRKYRCCIPIKTDIPKEKFSTFQTIILTHILDRKFQIMHFYKHFRCWIMLKHLLRSIYIWLTLDKIVRMAFTYQIKRHKPITRGFLIIFSIKSRYYSILHIYNIQKILLFQNESIWDKLKYHFDLLFVCWEYSYKSSFIFSLYTFEIRIIMNYIFSFLFLRTIVSKKVILKFLQRIDRL